MSKRQILALVTGNASNMTLPVKKLTEDWGADESEGDGSDTEQEVASTSRSFFGGQGFESKKFARIRVHTYMVTSCLYCGLRF